MDRDTPIIGTTCGVLLVCLTLVAISMWDRAPAQPIFDAQVEADVVIGDLFEKQWLAYQMGDVIHVIKLDSISGFVSNPKDGRHTVYFSGRQLFNELDEGELKKAVEYYLEHKPSLLDIMKSKWGDDL